jgi:hypothetical protein
VQASIAADGAHAQPLDGDGAQADAPCIAARSTNSRRTPRRRRCLAVRAEDLRAAEPLRTA